MTTGNVGYKNYSRDAVQHSSRVETVMAFLTLLVQFVGIVCVVVHCHCDKTHGAARDESTLKAVRRPGKLGAKQSQAPVAYYEDSIYIFGGCDILNGTGDIYKYDISGGKVVPLHSKLPNASCMGSAVSDSEGNMYHLGGVSSFAPQAMNKQVSRLTVTEGTTTVTLYASWPSARFYLATLLTSKNSILSFGGHSLDSSSIPPPSEEFQVSSKTWKSLRGFPRTFIDDSPSAVEIDNVVVVFGQFREPLQNRSNNIVIYDANADSSEWLHLPDLANFNFKSQAVADDEFAYVLGYWNNDTVSIFKFDVKNHEHRIYEVPNYPNYAQQYSSNMINAVLDPRRRCIFFFHFVVGQDGRDDATEIWCVPLPGQLGACSTVIHLPTVKTTTPTTSSPTSTTPASTTGRTVIHTNPTTVEVTMKSSTEKYNSTLKEDETETVGVTTSSSADHSTPELISTSSTVSSKGVSNRNALLTVTKKSYVIFMVFQLLAFLLVIYLVL